MKAIVAVLCLPVLAFAAVPDPAASPGDSASLLWQLYKAGHLVPALIVAGFMALTLAQRWVSWLRTGWRKLAVTAVLAGAAMLAERAAEGTVPSLPMVMGAFGAVLTLYMKGEGESGAPPAPSA